MQILIIKKKAGIYHKNTKKKHKTLVQLRTTVAFLLYPCAN